MKLWKVLISNDSTQAFTKKEYDKGWLDLLDKMKAEQSLIDDWEEVCFVFDKSRKNDEIKPLPDLIRGVVVCAISQKAKILIDSYISGQVEYLPIQTPVGPYYELDVKRLDCLNVDSSTVKRFKSSGRIMDVEYYSFRWKKLKGKHIFRLPELGLSKLFISNELKEFIERNDLKGFMFREVTMVDHE